MALAVERGTLGKAVARAVMAILAVVIAVSSALPMVAGPRTAAARERDRARADAALSIVVLPRGTDPVAAAAALGVEPVHVYRNAITGFAAALPPGAVTAARSSRSVNQIQPDGIVRIQGEPVDPVGKNRKKKKNKRQKVVRPQRVPTGYRRIETTPGGYNGIGVAVLDTGVARVRDIRVVGGKSCVKGGPYRDRNGHGTHVAGTVAALNNKRDSVGIAPNANIYAVKVLDDDGSGRWSDVICGLEWVVQNKARINVVNMSLAGDGTNDGSCLGDALHAAICGVVDAGIPVVVAAGNQGGDVATRVPAAYPEVITVAAFADSNGLPPASGEGPKTCDRSPDDVFWRFSNDGEEIDITAPGACISSLRPNGGVIRYSGTSMATPHVTGALVRFLAANPAATPDDAKGWLMDEASVAPGDDDYAAYGLRNGAHRILWFGGGS